MPKLLPSYFRQQFAQVTNPPIDPIRERLVMSLTSKLGYRHNWFGESIEHAKQVELESPILFRSEFDRLCSLDDPAFHTATLSVLFRVSEGEDGMRNAIEKLCQAAEGAADEGKFLIVLSDPRH